MKTLLISFLGLAASTASGQQNAALEFNATIPEIPRLSLLESAKDAVPPVFREGAEVLFKGRPLPARPPRLSSRMPVITPPEDLKYHLRVEAPDDAVDYKMLVKAPDIASSNEP